MTPTIRPILVEPDYSKLMLHCRELRCLKLTPDAFMQALQLLAQELAAKQEN